LIADTENMTKIPINPTAPTYIKIKAKETTIIIGAVTVKAFTITI
jgi:hypothetical protein